MMFHKISFYVNEKQLKQKKILNFFKNVLLEKKKKNWKIQIISNDYLRDLNLLKYFLKIIINWHDYSFRYTKPRY